MQRKMTAAVVALLVLVPAPGNAQTPAAAADSVDHYPIDGWFRYADPEEAGWSQAGLTAARTYADSVGAPVGLLVHDGFVVTSWGDIDHHANVASVSKALQGTLVGIALAAGDLQLDATLGQFGIEDDPPLLPTELRARVRDLLTMRSGVFHRAVGESWHRPKPERGSSEPGTTFMYHEWDPAALNVVFERSTGRSFVEAFTEELAEPLGFEDFDAGNITYVTNPMQSTLARVSVRLSARDMGRIGLLYLREGRWGDRQILAPEWVRESSRPHVPVGPNYFGYYLWIPGEGELAELNGYSLAGNGNVITIVPEAEVVFVHRSHSLYDGPSGQEIRQILLRLLRARTDRPAMRPEFVPIGGAEDAGSR